MRFQDRIHFNAIYHERFVYSEPVNLCCATAHRSEVIHTIWFFIVLAFAACCGRNAGVTQMVVAEQCSNGQGKNALAPDLLKNLFQFQNSLPSSMERKGGTFRAHRKIPRRNNFSHPFRICCYFYVLMFYDFKFHYLLCNNSGFQALPNDYMMISSKERRFANGCRMRSQTPCFRHVWVENIICHSVVN